jgi:hypothetical protein
MSEKGVIQFRDRSKQLNSFAGMVFRRGITPTDFDGFIDYNGELFILLEGKLVGKDLPNGQKMAIENLCASINASKMIVAIVFEHDTPIESDVDVKNCLVRAVYYHPRWHDYKERRLNVMEMIHLIEDNAKNAGLKI